MVKDQRVIYLANVAFIAAADGKIKPSEAKAIESIRKEIGATESDLRTALTRVAQGSHTLFPVGRFSDKIRNLEDMVFVSLKDDEFVDSEKTELLLFAKSIQITQDQLRGLLSESKARVLLQKTALTCDSCEKEIPSDSKFCPQCGVKVKR
jgi:Zn finger protein HypA/HybF involved in hydrogenase expression